MKNQLQKNIQNFGGIEFGVFKLKESVTEKVLFDAIDEMVKGLYQNEECFLGHALLKGQDDIYVEVVLPQARKKQLIFAVNGGGKIIGQKSVFHTLI